MKKVVLNLFTLLLSTTAIFSQTLIKDIAPGLADSDPHAFYPFLNHFVFAADDGFNGTELYYSDGTANGTVQLTNLYTVNSNPQYPPIFTYSAWPLSSTNLAGSAFTEIDGMGYFFGYTAQNKYSFFKTDGTTTGTEIIFDSISGINLSGLTRIFKMNTKICFLAGDEFYQYEPINNTFNIISNSLNSEQILSQGMIWNGGHGGNVASNRFAVPYVYNNKLYAVSQYSDTIYRMDINGNISTVTTIPYLEFRDGWYFGNQNVGPIINNKFLYHTYNTSNNVGDELYYFDFTTETGGLLKDVNPFFNYGSDIQFFYLPAVDSFHHNFIYFLANTENYGHELWVTDGTTSGTHIVEDYSQGPTSISWWNTYGSYINNYVSYLGDSLMPNNFDNSPIDSIHYQIANTNNIADYFILDTSNSLVINPNIIDFNTSGDFHFSTIYHAYGGNNVRHTIRKFSNVFQEIGYLMELSCINIGGINPGNTFKIDNYLYFTYTDCDFTGVELFKYDLNGPFCAAFFTLSPDPNQQHNWFAINASNGDSPLNYTWDWGDGSSSTGTNPSHVYSTPGYYNICVTVTSGLGCSDTYCSNSTYIYKTDAEMITINVITPNGIEEETGNLSIEIYPNPVTTEITINGYNPAYLKLSNMLGQTVAEANKSNKLYVGNLSQGLYALQVFDENGQVVKTEKVIVGR